MQRVQDFKGLGGMLNGFRDLVSEAEKITFVGSPGFCTPFALFLGYSVKEKKLVFVPGLVADKARSIVITECGLELGGKTTAEADILVVFGGMAMPKIGVTPQEMAAFLQTVPHEKLIGVCFMGIFEKAGWYSHLKFDYVMNAILGGEISKG
jgi:hypothetical protein